MTRLWRRRGRDEMRRVTELFIDDSPSTIRLIPHKSVPRPGGTHEFVALKARRPQTFRIIPFGANTEPGKQPVEGMEISRWTYHLIGNYDCEMEEGDTWCWKGVQYRIQAILPQNNWERRGLAIVFGKAPPENIKVNRAREIPQPPWIGENIESFVPQEGSPP